MLLSRFFKQTWIMLSVAAESLSRGLLPEVVHWLAGCASDETHVEPPQTFPDG